MDRFLPFFVIPFFLGCFSPSIAAETQTINVSTLDYCGAVSMQVCGITFNVPASGIGTTQNFTLPEKYATRNVVFQCIDQGGRPFFRLMNENVNSCKLRSCAPSVADFCGGALPINVAANVGDTVKVTVPQEYLSTAKAASPPVLTAQCSLINGVEQYQLTDAHRFSCSDLACAPTTLTINNCSVVLSSPADLGAVVHVATTDNQPVTVQCLGSGGTRPTYQIVDHAVVACGQ